MIHTIMTGEISAEKKKLSIRQIALVGLMTSVICILGPWALHIPVSPVPISLGMLAIYFVTSVLGMKLGFVSVMIYLLLGLTGLPVFTDFMGGPGKLLGPTGGYLIGYLFMALICGFFTDKWSDKIVINFFGMILGTAACYLFGTLWLGYQLSLSFTEALMIGVIPYIPGDMIKLVIAIAIGSRLRKRLHTAGLI